MYGLIIIVAVVMVGYFIVRLLNQEEARAPAPVFIPEPKKKVRTLGDVRSGEFINVKWSRFLSGVGKLKCINNDPISKKIHLRVQWSNYLEQKISEYEHFVWGYDDYRLSDFSLLNPVVEEEKKEEKPVVKPKEFPSDIRLNGEAPPFKCEEPIKP